MERKKTMAKYSEISKNRYKNEESNPMKYIIRPGNNSKLVKRVFEESGRCEQSNDGHWFPGWEHSDD